MYLGVARDYVGSAIRCFLLQGVWDYMGLATPNEILSQVHADMLAECKAHGILT